MSGLGKNADVVVVGGGAIGAAIAYFLAREGVRVTVLERAAVGGGSTGHATGSLALLGAEFTPGAYCQLARASSSMFNVLVPEIEDLTTSNVLYLRRAAARIALDEDEEHLIREAMVWQKNEGIEVEWIGPDDLRQIEGRLTERVRGGAYESDSAQIDSYRLNLALIRAMELCGGTILHRRVTGLVTEHDTVTGVRCGDEKFGCGMVVVAAGPWSGEAASWLNYPVPVRPLKGERLALRYTGAPISLLISSPRRGHIITRLDGLTSVGSTRGADYDQRMFDEVPGSFDRELDRHPTDEAKVQLLNRALDVIPDLESAEIAEHLAGPRPLSPDQWPIIGPVPGWNGVMLATGHTTRGIHLAPITARIITDLITSGRTPLPVEPFLPDRFASLAHTVVPGATHATVH